MRPSAATTSGAWNSTRPDGPFDHHAADPPAGVADQVAETESPAWNDTPGCSTARSAEDRVQRLAADVVAMPDPGGIAAPDPAPLGPYLEVVPAPAGRLDPLDQAQLAEGADGAGLEVVGADLLVVRESFDRSDECHVEAVPGVQEAAVQPPTLAPTTTRRISSCSGLLMSGEF